MNRGEVWWLQGADGDRRPACILTRQGAIPVLNALLVVPATRTVRGIPTEVALGPDNGMPDECALTFDNAGIVPKHRLTERITRLGPAKLGELCKALTVTAGC